MRFLRTVALAHGHPPERIDGMAVSDLEALAIYDMVPDMVRLAGLGNA